MAMLSWVSVVLASIGGVVTVISLGMRLTLLRHVYDRAGAPAVADHVPCHRAGPRTVRGVVRILV